MSSLNSKPCLKSDDLDVPIDEDQGIIRCICGFIEDDGFTIQCENCLVWQHAICVNITQNNVPDEYLCEQCYPRKLNVKRAIEYQRQRLDKEYRLAKENRKKKRTSDGRAKSIDKKSSRFSDNSGTNSSPSRNDRGYSSSHNSSKFSTSSDSLAHFLDHQLNSCIVDSEEVLIYIQNATHSNPSDSQNPHNLYTSIHSSSIIPVTNLNVKPIGNPRYKQFGLFTNQRISSKQFISEYKGKLILKSDYIAEPKSHYNTLRLPKPFVAFHPNLNLCIDARTDGNIVRFVRKSCNPNLSFSSLEVVDYPDPKIILGVYAKHDIEEGEELTLNWSWEDDQLPTIPKSDPSDSSSYLSTTEGRRLCKIWRQSFYGTKCNCNKGSYCKTQEFFNLLDLEKDYKRSSKNSPNRRYKSSSSNRNSGNLKLDDHLPVDILGDHENDNSDSMLIKNSNHKSHTSHSSLSQTQRKDSFKSSRNSNQKYHLSLPVSKSDFINNNFELYSDKKRSKSSINGSKPRKSHDDDNRDHIDVDYNSNDLSDESPNEKKFKISNGYYPTVRNKELDGRIVKSKKQKKSRVRIQNSFISLKKRWINIYLDNIKSIESVSSVNVPNGMKNELNEISDNQQPVIETDITNAPIAMDTDTLPLADKNDLITLPNNMHEPKDCEVNVDLAISNNSIDNSIALRDDHTHINVEEPRKETPTIPKDPSNDSNDNHKFREIAPPSLTKISKVELDMDIEHINKPIKNESYALSKDVSNIPAKKETDTLPKEIILPEPTSAQDETKSTPAQPDSNSLKINSLNKKNRLSLEEYNKKRRTTPLTNTFSVENSQSFEASENPSKQFSGSEYNDAKIEISTINPIDQKTAVPKLSTTNTNSPDLVLISGVISKPSDSISLSNSAKPESTLKFSTSLDPDSKPDHGATVKSVQYDNNIKQETKSISDQKSENNKGKIHESSHHIDKIKNSTRPVENVSISKNSNSSSPAKENTTNLEIIETKSKNTALELTDNAKVSENSKKSLSEVKKDDKPPSPPSTAPVTKVKVSLEEYNRRRMQSVSSKTTGPQASSNPESSDASAALTASSMSNTLDTLSSHNNPSKGEEITQLLRKELDGIVAPTVISNAVAQNTPAKPNTPPYSFKNSNMPFSVTSAATSFTSSSGSSLNWANNISSNVHIPLSKTTLPDPVNVSTINKASSDSTQSKPETSSQIDPVKPVSQTLSSASLGQPQISWTQNNTAPDAYDSRFSDNKAKPQSYYSKNEQQSSYNSSYNKHEFSSRKYDKDRPSSNYSLERDRSRDRTWDADRDKQWNDRQRDFRDSRSRFYNRDRDRHNQFPNSSYTQSSNQPPFNSYRRERDRHSTDFQPNRTEQSYEKEAGEITYPKDRKGVYDREKERWRDSDHSRDRESWPQNQHPSYQQSQNTQPSQNSFSNNSQSLAFNRPGIRPSNGYNNSPSYNPANPTSYSRPMSPVSESSFSLNDIKIDKRASNTSPRQYINSLESNNFSSNGLLSKNSSKPSGSVAQNSDIKRYASKNPDSSNAGDSDSRPSVIENRPQTKSFEPNSQRIGLEPHNDGSKFFTNNVNKISNNVGNSQPPHLGPNIPLPLPPNMPLPLHLPLHPPPPPPPPHLPPPPPPPPPQSPPPPPPPPPFPK
ncbi:SET domain-containing protein 3 [Smittium culicis]|uniref:SET domain-containing protein 3 n=1 Tax=Smittium culicis TaxID=133412 RepID=A0A1R1XG09_9FUNG|nr:SET domain-containing protein 3 [Smittium culicis]